MLRPAKTYRWLAKYSAATFKGTVTRDRDWLRGRILARALLGEEPSSVLKFSCSPSLFNIQKCTMVASRKMDRNFLGYAISHWERLLKKAVGKPLDTAERVQGSRWEMPEGYWIASRQF
jgi:hypothetical protein